MKLFKSLLYIIILVDFVTCNYFDPANPYVGDYSGSIDRTFGENGFVILDLYNNNEDVLSSIISSNDSFYGIGYSNLSIDNDFIIIKFKKNGSVDKSFGNSGFITTDLGGDDQAFGACIQPDGKIVSVGDSFSVVRYNIDGTLDTSFSGDGIQSGISGRYNEIARFVTIDDSNNIIVGGSSSTYSYSTSSSATILRYTENGILDNSFSGDGLFVGAKTLKSLQYNDKIFASYNWDINIIDDDGSIEDTIDNADGVIRFNDNKIICGGYDYYSWDQIFVERFTSDYQLDSIFGENGISTIDLIEIGDYEYSSRMMVIENSLMEIYKDDIYLVFTYYHEGEEENSNILIIKLDKNGDICEDFNNNGLTDDTGFLDLYTNAQDKATGMIVNDDGILISGYTNRNGSKDFMLFRVNL